MTSAGPAQVWRHGSVIDDRFSEEGTSISRVAASGRKPPDACAPRNRCLLRIATLCDSLKCVPVTCHSRGAVNSTDAGPRRDDGELSQV